MRYAIISDIHGNLEALKKVLRSIDKNGADEIICLGDIIGYGANPNECLWHMRKPGIQIRALIGNHECAVLDESIASYFNDFAQEAICWTKKALSPENLEYIIDLPFLIKIPNILCVHSSPAFPDRWDYIEDSITAWGEFESFTEKIAFVGHSHRPVIFSSRGGQIYPEDGATYHLEGGLRYIINPGSVGQPRDRDARASYGILDTKSLTFTLFRLQYNIKKTAAKIWKNGLPGILAERLFVGK